MFKQKFYLLVILFAFANAAHAQKANYAVQDSALTRLRNDYPQEDVFLQTDKDWYFSGETIWFKAWCVAESAPTFLSRILYVDIVDANGKVFAKKMYKLDSISSARGDFTLPAEVKSGNFSINAYTLWMLNTPAFVFRKPIFIYSNDYVPQKEATTGVQALKVNFFPEGGDLIGGVANRVAFRITNANGMPVSARGSIEDASGKKVADLATEHDGMGSVEFNVESGKDYTAFISVNNGTARLSYKLPKAKDEGIAMRIENGNPNRLFVLLNRAEKNKQLYNRVKVVAQINYQVVYAMELNIDEGQSAVTITKKNLPPGILQITVFNDKDLPVAERIAFIENYDINSPAIKLDQKDMKARGKNQVSVAIDSTDLSSLSFLVTTGNEKQPADENIISSLLLSANLPGYIYQPGYYFKNKNATTLRHLDLLLMTQGWRRFDWKKIMNKEFAKLSYPVESAISFRGSMHKSDRKEIIKDGRISFIIKTADSTTILAEAATTDKGEFLLNDVNYSNNAKVAYMGTNKNKENLIVDVKLAPNYIDTLAISANRSSINLDTSGSVLPSQLQQLNDMLADPTVKLLQGVTVKAKKVNREDSLNMAYAGGPFLMGKSLDPASFKNYITIWQMIQAAVPGVTLEGNPYDPEVSFSRFAGLNSASGDPLGGEEGSMGITMQENGIAYFLNEVNVTKDVITGLNIDDIALIKVLKNEAAVLGATQGAIAIYTKRGVSGGKAIYEKTYTTEDHLGYAVSKEYAPPMYVFDKDAKFNDNRYTLYWNGSPVLGKDGKYHLTFYNNDSGTKARIIVQGIDKSGQLIYNELFIE